jgi:dipeptidyl aminopeptidase/acylaminoacyl peptidase
VGAWLFVALLSAGLAAAGPQAPSSPEGARDAARPALPSTRVPVTPADYGKWENLGVGVLSDDGQWLAVPITRVDGTARLDVHRVGAAAAGSSQEPGGPSGPFYTAREGRAPAFSADGAWVAYRVGVSETERETLQDEKKPVRDAMGLLRLDVAAARPEPVVMQDVARWSFAPAAPFIAIHRYLPDGVKRKGADLLVRNLATGATTAFGNVAEFAWQDEGRLLAFTIDADGKAGNGVQVFDPQTGLLRLLDSGEATFSGLVWREKDDDLACFRSRTDDGFEEDTHVVLAWRDLAAAGTAVASKSYDHATDKAFPADMRVVPFRRLQWARAGGVLYFGIQEWVRKPKKDTKEANPAAGADAKAPKPAAKEKPADVDVWHSKDERIIPMQRVQKARDLERHYASAWRVDEGTWLKLGTDAFEQVTILDGDRFAIETDRKPYIAQNMFDTARQDVYVIDLASGRRTKAVTGVWHFPGASPGGRYLLYFHGDQYWTYEPATGRTANISGGLKTVWANPDYDTPFRVQRPPAGIGGWLQDDAAVLLYDQHDVWRVAPDGSGGARLTRGAEDATQYRYVRLDPDERGIDPRGPVYLNTFGRWTKKDGYSRLAVIAPPGASQPSVERLPWADKSIGNIIKAKRADVYAYSVQAFDDSPDLVVGGPELTDARQVTRTNDFQADYAWGRSSLVDYRNSRSERLQGALYYPAGYVPGRRYPMIVYVYERLSQGVHNYVVPSERSPYNASVFTANGYFVLHPDIVFRPRDPGIAALDCVTAAVRAVLATGMVDPKRVGLVGHSWGGYEASFIPTQTGIFAASIAGAPITNLLSFYGAIHWGPGLPEPAHFETGQARMEVPFWADLPAYIRNSPTIFVDKLQAPLLIFFGDKDGTVDFRQGVELYNYARRAGKHLVMLVYANEDHGARAKPNQIDYHRRILQWFGHYLKGEEAPAWVTKGVTVIDGERASKTR